MQIAKAEVQTAEIHKRNNGYQCVEDACFRSTAASSDVEFSLTLAKYAYRVEGRIGGEQVNWLRNGHGVKGAVT